MLDTSTEDRVGRDRGWLPGDLERALGLEAYRALEQVHCGVTTEDRPRRRPLCKSCGHGHAIADEGGRGVRSLPVAHPLHHDEPRMQARAPYRCCSQCRPLLLLACGQPPPELERHVHRPPGIVFVRRRHAKHRQEALAHHWMEPPPILAYHTLGPRMEVQEQAMQGIEIKRRAVGRGYSHRPTEHGDRLALGLASRCRGRTERRWRRQWLPTGRAEHARAWHDLAAVDTQLLQAGATRRAEHRALVIGVLACGTAAYS